MVLHSNHQVSGDGHFYSGANFRITQNNSLGSLYSPSDPIILAIGDVSIGDYTGASLHILAGGSVQLGNVTINRVGDTPSSINPNNTNFIPGTNTPYSQLSPITLSDGKTTFSIDGSSRPTLDVRAGIDWNKSPFTGMPSITDSVAIPVGTVSFAAPILTAANIKVNNIRITPPNSVVYLTNQYLANPSLTGDIAFSSINTQNFIGSGSVFLNSSHNIYNNLTPSSNGLINTNSLDGKTGDVNLIAKNAIDLNNGARISAVNLGTGEAGDINIHTGTLSLKNGSVIVTATVGQGTGGNLTINASDVVELIGTTDTGFPSVIGSQTGGAGDAGSLTINTQRLIVKDGAFISGESFSPGKGSNVNINVAESLEIIGTSANSQFRSAITTTTQGAGDAGSLTINTQRLTVKDGAFISGNSFSPGRGSNVNINVAESLEIIGTSADGNSRSAITTIVEGTGDAGNLNIETRDLTVKDGALISGNSFPPGRGSNVNINVAESLEVIGTSANSQFRSAITTIVEGTGDGGNLNMEIRNLTIRDGGFISTTTLNQGNSGQLIVNASDSVELIGSDGQFATGLFTDTSNASGNGGNLEITANRLLILNGANVSASSFDGGKAGDLSINTMELTEVIGTRIDETGRLISSGFSNFTTGSNDAGDVTINTRLLLLKDGGQVANGTTGSGNGGNLTVKATENVKIIGTGINGEFSSGLNTKTEFEGAGGVLTINTPKLELKDGGQVSVTSFGEGKAGSIIINANDLVELTGTSSVGSQFPSAILSQVFLNSIAGSVIINTNELNINNKARITVNSFSDSKAGDLQASARVLRLDNQGQILAKTASGDGGNIILNIQDLLRLRTNSQISTTAGTQETGGDGGNININAPNGFIVAFPDENSDITANAFQGKGGNININAQSIFALEQRPSTPPNNTNDIDASSQFGLTGTIIINTPDIDPGRGLLQLPDNFTDVSQQIVSSCNPGSQARRSSFTVTGRGGIARSPIEPFQGEVSTAQWITLDTIKDSQDSNLSSESLLSPQPKIVEAQGWIIDQNGNVSLVAQVPNITPHRSAANRFCSSE